MKHKTSELEGALLDSAVAKADGWERVDGEESRHATITTWAKGHDYEMLGNLAFSTDWEIGGPLIEREQIGVWRGESDDFWRAAMNVEVSQNCRADHGMFGPAPLIAAMRAYVASKFGDEVELP